MRAGLGQRGCRTRPFRRGGEHAAGLVDGDGHRECDDMNARACRAQWWAGYDGAVWAGVPVYRVYAKGEHRHRLALSTPLCGTDDVEAVASRCCRRVS
eukprot:scaffold5312_cov118-Isochrysis_galbana.AAC.13